MTTSVAWPDRGQLLEMAAEYRGACVLGAAAELELFGLLAREAMTAQTVAAARNLDLRACTMLLDALASLRLLDKREERYRLPEELRPWLEEESPGTVIPMVRHQMVILRKWTQLAWVVRSGKPGETVASIRGAQADRAAFIAAMHSISGPLADDLVARLGPLAFRHLLDVGGASGTWTIALLRAVPGARATIFDLPDAIEQARARFAATELADRVELVAGDFYRDELPPGADFVWVSAIIHQHGREESRALFGKAYRALPPGGRIAIRDFVMEHSRTEPIGGALFAINMLVNTERGGTFTFDEIAEDLLAAGFVEPDQAVRSDQMNSVVVARRN